MAWETGCRSALIENSRDAVKAKYAEQSDDVTKLMFTKMYLIFWRVVFTEEKSRATSINAVHHSSCLNENEKYIKTKLKQAKNYLVPEEIICFEQMYF